MLYFKPIPFKFSDESGGHKFHIHNFPHISYSSSPHANTKFQDSCSGRDTLMAQAQALMSSSPLFADCHFLAQPCPCVSDSLDDSFKFHLATAVRQRRRPGRASSLTSSISINSRQERINHHHGRRRPHRQPPRSVS